MYPYRAASYANNGRDYEIYRNDKYIDSQNEGRQESYQNEGFQPSGVQYDEESNQPSFIWPVKSETRQGVKTPLKTTVPAAPAKAVVQPIRREASDSPTSACPTNECPKSDSEVYGVLREALKDEAGDAKDIEQLMYIARSPEDRETLRQIRMDEQKHYKLFQEVCHAIGGEKPHVEAERFDVYDDAIKAYEKKMFKKHKSVDFYRKILFAVASPLLRDMLYEIITDEQNHASQFMYLYAKNKLHECCGG
ncbi:MAG: ferritin-like domain-containing protein [Clostridiales bacterium]|jgi:rubrerythrin|nr:ferritin-like domain-containing protein [Clostridiales bacterium]